METRLKNMVEVDEWLLRFDSYKDYLKHIITKKDLYYLMRKKVARTLAEMGFLTPRVETLTREEFERRVGNVKEAILLKKIGFRLASANVKPVDVVYEELAFRERSNRVGLLATVIFIRHRNSRGLEISGYIDYAQSLKQEDWVAIFQGRKRIIPRYTDLGFYNWNKRISYWNSSLNFQTMVDEKRGMIFRCRTDRIDVYVNPRLRSPGRNSSRVTIKTDLYHQVVLYDHVVRDINRIRK